MRLLAVAAVAVSFLLASVVAPAHAASDPRAAQLERLAPHADPVAIELALGAMECAQAHGEGAAATRLTVIDYSKPSLTPRLWVFDLARDQLLFEEYVAHGRNSGDNYARDFSNADGSLKTSLGLFLTADTYQGGNGYSLRLKGLDHGLNDRAYERAIVVHGAPYVDPVAGKAQGRLGRSYGCPALRPAVAASVIDAIKGGNFVFSYFPGEAMRTRAALTQCADSRNATLQASNAGAASPARAAAAP